MRSVVLALVLVALLAPAAVARPVVAVLDTGVDVRHPDLRGALWTNPAEVAGNTRDDDGDGLADDVHGADLVRGRGRVFDPRGHGTHVAGIIAGPARIMAVRVLGPRGTGSAAQLAAGLDYAVAHGARIVNVSAGYYPRSALLLAALQRAGAAGVLVIAAAGNGGEDLDREPAFPAAFDLPNLISVAAADARGGLFSWSARGSSSVTLAAPGGSTRSALPRGRHGRRSGTSVAAAKVSRAAAALLAAHPQAGVAELRAALVDGARPAALGGKVSGGLLDLEAASRLLSLG